MRLLHDGGELVEMVQRDDGSGGAGGDDGDVHLQERRRGTFRVILRIIGGATIYDEASWCSAFKQEEI